MMRMGVVLLAKLLGRCCRSPACTTFWMAAMHWALMAIMAVMAVMAIMAIVAIGKDQRQAKAFVSEFAPASRPGCKKGETSRDRLAARVDAGHIPVTGVKLWSARPTVVATVAR